LWIVFCGLELFSNVLVNLTISVYEGMAGDGFPAEGFFPLNLPMHGANAANTTGGDPVHSTGGDPVKSTCGDPVNSNGGDPAI
jgi:hypothetical protein